MPVKVIIRADGNSDIGFGHIIRTQALARQLAKAGAEVIFLTRNPENIDSYSTIAIPGHMGLDDEDALIEQVVGEESPVLFVIDNYAFNQYRLDRAAVLGIKTAYIDDMNLYEFNTTYVINGNLYAPRLHYRGQARFLLGSEYLLMREQFIGISPREVKPQVRDILLTFGAADTNNLTAMIIKQIINVPRFDKFKWHVIIGPAFRQIPELEVLARNSGNIFLHHNPDVKKLMKNCDISISAAGSTTYEMAACGLPSIVITAADNQAMLAEEAERRGISVSLGRFERIGYENLERSLNRLLDDYKLRKSMAAAGQKIIDGKGAFRTARVLLGLNYI